MKLWRLELDVKDVSRREALEVRGPAAKATTSTVNKARGHSLMLLNFQYMMSNILRYPA